MKEQKMKILKFYADWCQPCKNLSTTLKGMDVPFPIVEIDIDDNVDASIEYGIRSVPTMLFVDDNNNILGRYTGLRTKVELQEMFEKFKGSTEQ